MSTLAEIYKRNNVAKGSNSSLPSGRTNNYITNAPNYEDEDSANNGGFLGGVGYVAEKFGLGVMSSLEGIWDYAAGGIAKLVGADEWAEEQFANDWMNYNHADEWFDPGDGWKVAGDVFGGIGTSVPSIAASFVPGVGIGLSIAVAGLSAAGNATKEAYRQTGELGLKEFGYGAMVGATEGLVEYATKGLGKGTGRIITAAQQKATGKVATVLAKFSSKSIFKQLTEDFISEAIEEGLAEAVAPFYARMTYDENAELASAEEIFYSAFVGGLSGLIMSGASSAALTGSNYRSGKKAVDAGRADKIMEVGRQIAEYENKDGGTDIEAFKTVKSDYDELTASLEKTDGKVETTKQKMLLGALEKANIAAIFDPFIERGAEASILNADAIAKTYSEVGAKDSAGNTITFTAEQIRSGVDPNLLYSADKTLRRQGVRQLRKALKSNSTLATLAVMQATGNIMMDAEKLSTAARNGAIRVTDDNLRILKETASDAQKNELARELGYDSLDGFMGASGDDVRARIEGYLFKNADKIRESAGRIKLARTSFAQNTDGNIENTLQEKGISYKPLPKSFKSNMADGAYIFNEAGENIGIIKEKDSFYVYDYSSDKISKPLSVTEINKAIKEAKEKSSISIKMESVDNSSDERLALSDNNAIIVEEDAELLERLKNAKKSKYTVIKEYLVEKFYGQDFLLSDGVKAVMDKSDAQHISDTSPLKIAQLSNLREIIEKAKYSHKAESVVHDKFDEFRYYSFSIKYGSNTFEMLLNVGRSKYNKEYHIYDITKNGRATNQASPDLVRSVDNALKNSSSNNSISQTSENINSNEKKSSNNLSNVTDSGETKLDAAAIGAWARENVKGYASLPEPSKRAVRDTIRQARAHGIPDNEIVIAARVAARSGLNVVYDKILIEGDGKYNGRNTIYIDPKAPKERRCARLLLHEGGHALKGEKGFIKLLARATRLASPDKAKEIRDKYTEYYKSKKIDKEIYEPIIEEEIAMAAIEETIGVDGAWDYILSKKPSISEKFLSFFRGAARDYSDLNDLSKEARKLLREYKKIFDAFAEKNQGNNARTDARISDGERYALSANAKAEVKKALNDKNYSGEIKLTDSSPSILLTQNGVRNLPMIMNASHLRENIFTEAEAKKIGLRVHKSINYHGLGEDLFLTVIDDLDNVTEAYRGTKNAEKSERREKYFLLISQHTDKDGNIINIPVYINEKGLYNRVFIDTNKISTVFGRSEFRKYINEQISKGNLVRIKTRSTQNSESTSPIKADYELNASDSSIAQNSEKSTLSAKKDTGERLALPNNPDSDKVTISKLELAKIKANYRSDKVFYKKDVESAMNKIEAFSDLSPADRKEIITNICIGLNDRVDEQHLELFTKVSYYRIRAEIEQLRGFDLTREELSVMDTQIKTALEDILNSGRPSAKSKIRETVKAEEYAKELNRDLSKYKKELRDAAKQREISKKTTEKRNSVRRKLGMLNNRLLNASKTKNVPWFMSEAVRDALKSFDIRSQNLVELAEVEKAIYQEKKRVVPDESKLIKLEKKRARLEATTVNARFEISALYEAYESLSKPTNEDAVKNEYSQDVAERLKGLKAITGNTPLAKMSLEQLEAFDEFITMFFHQADNYNKLRGEEQNKKVSESAETIIAEIEQVKVPSLFNPRKGEWVVGSQIRKYVWKALKPMQVFDVIGSAELSAQALRIFEAETACGQFIADAQQKLEEIAKNNNYDKYRKDMDERKPFKLANGKTVKISLSELMSLFAWGRRESANTHLEGLGFVFHPYATYKGKNETKEGFSLRLERMINDSERYELSPEDFANISAALPEDIRNFVVEIQKFLSGPIAEAGNRISRELYGIELFKEENYFPMMCAKEWIDSEVSKTGDPKLKNMGITKALAPNAKNPLVLQPFIEIFSAHINNMALYTSFVIPLEDFYRILNYRRMGDIDNVADVGEFSYEKLASNAKNVTKMKAVAKLSKHEFEDDGIHSLKDRVVSFFDSFGNKVQTKEIGTVSVVASSFRDDKAHGLTRNKVISFKAIPEVLKEGRVIDIYKPTGKPYTRITIAAPITIGNEKYYVGVMVQKDNQSNRMYLHDIITEKATSSFNTEPAAQKSEGIRDEGHLFITSILQKALNVNDSNQNNSTVKKSKEASSLKAVIKDKYGEEAVRYIEQFLRDLNGGIVNSKPLDLMDKGIRNFKFAATAASFSTAIQQPTSIIRALAVMEAKYFPKKLLLDKSGRRWEELKKYAPIAVIKEMGGFDTGVGRSILEYLDEANYKGLGKIKGFVSDSEYRNKAFGLLATKMDKMGWVTIWEACKREAKDKNPELAIDSEKLLNIAGKRFTQVIQETQVYDSTLSRSEMMRSKDTGWKMATAFAAEPLTIFNMFVRAYVMKSRGQQGSGKIIKALIAASIVNVLLSSLVYAARDDDEDEAYLEKYVEAVSDKMLDTLNPLNLLPFARDVVSIIEGYDIERTDMAVIADIVNSYRRLTSSGEVTYEKAIDFIASTVQAIGIPGKNILRDARGMYNAVYSAFDDEVPTWEGIKNAHKEGVKSPFFFNEKRIDKDLKNANQLYDAAMSGNTKHYDRVFARYEDKDSALSALRSAMRDNDKRIEAAAQAKMSGDIETYQKLISEIVSEGHFERSLVTRAVTSEYLAIRRELEEYGNVVFVGDIAYTLSEEETKALEKQRLSLTNDVAHLSESNIYRKLSDEQRDIALAYAEDLITDAAESAVLGVDNGKNALLANVIGINNVAMLYALTKDLESDKDENGKTISGTKKRKIIAAIKSLGLSVEEQLLLLCAKGYSIGSDNLTKKRLLNYIIKLKNVTKEDKLRLAEMCGFQVKNGRIVQNFVA